MKLVHILINDEKKNYNKYVLSDKETFVLSETEVQPKNKNHQIILCKNIVGGIVNEILKQTMPDWFIFTKTSELISEDFFKVMSSVTIFSAVACVYCDEKYYNKQSYSKGMNIPNLSPCFIQSNSYLAVGGFNNNTYPDPNALFSKIPINNIMYHVPAKLYEQF